MHACVLFLSLIGWKGNDRINDILDENRLGDLSSYAVCERTKWFCTSLKC